MLLEIFHDYWRGDDSDVKRCLAFGEIMRKPFFVISIFILSFSVQASDFPSKKAEINEYARQIEKIEEFISVEQVKVDKNPRELKYLTDRKAKLIEQKMKKMLDFKDDLQKSIDSGKKNIQKLKTAESSSANSQQLRKLEDDLRTDEASLTELNSNIDTSIKTVKKQQDDEKAKKEEEKEKKKDTKKTKNTASK